MAIPTLVARRVIAALVLTPFLSSISLAVSIWDGGGRADSNWTTGANWFALFGPGVAPPNNGTEDIVFPAGGGLVQQPIVNVPYSIRSLTFNNGDGRFVILGAAELTIGAGGITNNDADIQSIIGPVKLSAHQTWNAAAGRLQMDAVNLNGFNLELAGAHQIDLPNLLLGTGMLTLADGYTSTVTMTGAGSNTYNGATHVNGGTLVLNKTSGAVAIPASLYIESIVRLMQGEQIAASGFVQVETGGLLDLNGHTETFARLIVSPDGSITTGAGRLNITQEFQVTGGDVTGNIGLGDVTADVTMDGHVSSGADLTIGDVGTGSLRVRLSSSFSNANGYIGDDAGSTGTVSVEGGTSAWTNAGNLYVGNGGMGTLNITGSMTGGGIVGSTNGYIGNASGSTGVVNVGMNSRWTNTAGLFVGNAGNGTLTVTGGGDVRNVDGRIGDDAGSMGEVTIDGSGSTWINSRGLYVGYAGNGTLNVTGGGSVRSEFSNVGVLAPGLVSITNAGEVFTAGFDIGSSNGAAGSVSIDGAGSILTIRNDSSPDPFRLLSKLTIWRGTLEIESGGHVDVGFDTVLAPAINTVEVFPTAGVTVDGADSQLNVDPDGDISSVDVFGALVIRNGGQVTNSEGLIERGGAVSIDGAGSAWLNVEELTVGSFGSGTLTVTNGGTVAGSVHVKPFGEIRGDGNIIGNVENDGLVSPGTSPGALHIEGDYTQTADGDLLIELASESSYDQLLVTGDAMLGGTLALDLIGGFVPSSGQTFALLTANDTDIFDDVLGEFDTLVLPSVPGLTFDVMYNAHSVVLTVSAVGVAGDYNNDGAVDAADYVVWRKNDGTQEGYDIWRANFGRSTGNGPAASGSAGGSTLAVPEPTALALIAFGLLGMIVRVRRPLPNRISRGALAPGFETACNQPRIDINPD